MRATEDASSIERAARPRRAASAATFFLALAGVGAGAALGAVFAPAVRLAGMPTLEAVVAWPDELPRRDAWTLAPRAGERVEGARFPDGTPALRVAGPDGARVAALAAAFERAAKSRALELDGRRAALVARAREDVITGPLPALAPAAECAARLRGWAIAMRALARDEVSDGFVPAPDTLLAASAAAIERAGLAADPAALALALDADAKRRAELDAREARARAGRPAEDLVQRWSDEQQARADRFEALALLLERDVTPFQRELVDLATADATLAAAAAIADPSQAWRAANPAGEPPAVRPLARWRFAVAGLGALLGAIAGLALARLVRGRLPRKRPFGAALTSVEAYDGPAGAWLQIVSGRRGSDVARGALELAARALAVELEPRVLVVDAGRGLRLESAFGADARLGLTECLEDARPALGLAQYGGAPGLFFLARGRASRRPAWLQLDRFLEDLRPHFGRVILAVDAGAPAEVGSVLAGRVMEGYWAGAAGSLPRAAQALEDRLAIRLHGLELTQAAEAALELVGERLRAMTTAPVPAPPRGIATLAPEVVAPLPEPAVLDCDLQVRQRLRFLVWAKRLRNAASEESGAPR